MLRKILIVGLAAVMVLGVALLSLVGAAGLVALWPMMAGFFATNTEEWRAQGVSWFWVALCVLAQCTWTFYLVGLLGE